MIPVVMWAVSEDADEEATSLRRDAIYAINTASTYVPRPHAVISLEIRTFLNSYFTHAQCADCPVAGLKKHLHKNLCVSRI